MSKDEVKTVSASGGVKAGNAQRGSLIPPKVLLEIAEHYGKGALKYDDNNWAKGYEWSKSYDALTRHLFQFWAGEDRDICHCPDSVVAYPCDSCGATGAKHITAVAWHAIALSHFMDRFPEYDDRFNWEGKTEKPKDEGKIMINPNRIDIGPGFIGPGLIHNQYADSDLL